MKEEHKDWYQVVGPPHGSWGAAFLNKVHVLLCCLDSGENAPKLTLQKMWIKQGGCSAWLNRMSLTFNKLLLPLGAQLAKGIDACAASQVEPSGILGFSSLSSPTSMAPSHSPIQPQGEAKTGKSESFPLDYAFWAKWLTDEKDKDQVHNSAGFPFTSVLMVPFLSKSKARGAKGCVASTSFQHLFWPWRKKEGIWTLWMCRKLLCPGSRHNSLCTSYTQTILGRKMIWCS